MASAGMQQQCTDAFIHTEPKTFYPVFDLVILKWWGQFYPPSLSSCESFLAAPTTLTKMSSYQWEINNLLKNLNTVQLASLGYFQYRPTFGKIYVPAELPLFFMQCNLTSLKILLTSVHCAKTASSKMLVYQNDNLSHKCYLRNSFSALPALLYL